MDALGTNAFIGISESDHIGVPKDPSEYFDAITTGLKGDISPIDVKILRPGVYQDAAQKLQGLRSASGDIKMPFNPTGGIRILKHLLGAVTSTQQGATAAYKHRFLGADTFASESGLSIMVNKDLEAFHYFGMLVNTLTLSFEQGNPVQATYGFVGKDVSTGKGTAGTSTGQNAISFPVTLVASTSDQIKLAVDGGTAVELTIPAAAYATGAALSAAINTVIAGTSALLDSSRNPEVACYVNSSNKLVFYTADKKSTASVAWTAGTHDAGTLLGRGTPVEAAGANALATPTFTTVLPFIFTQGIVKVDGVEIECEKLTLTINNGLIKKNVLGRDSYVGANKGTRIVSGSFGKWFSETAIYEKFRANSDATIKLELRTGVECATGYYYDCDIFMNKVRYGNPEPTVPGNDPLKHDVPFTAYYADATYKDIAIDVTNLETSY